MMSLSRLDLLAPFFLGLILLVGSLFAVDGLFVIDEFFYLAAAQRIWSSGSLIIANGFEVLNLQALRAAFFIDGPNGLTSPYPAGFSAFQSIGYGVAGLKGMIIQNALVGAGTIAFVFLLSIRFFDDKGIAALSTAIFSLCTFWAEYVYSIESHALGVLLVTLTIFSAVSSLEAEVHRPKTAFIWAMASGACIGVGLLVRSDTILLLPITGILAVLCSKDPVRVILFGGLGIAPFILIGMLVNDFKFGTLNPLSYGGTGGGTSVGGHRIYASLLMLIAMVVVTARILGNRMAYWIGGGVVVLALFLSDDFRAALLAVAKGFAALVVDSSGARLRSDMNVNAHGILEVQGWAKMALGQSMPWVAMVVALPFVSWRSERRAVWHIMWLVPFLWSLTFWAQSWDGGFGGNMRYFLPTFPVLSIFAAVFFAELARKSDCTGPCILLGAIAGISFWFLLGLSLKGGWRVAGFHAGYWCFFAVIPAVFVATKVPGLGLAVCAAAFSVASINSVRDVFLAQERRADFRKMNEEYAAQIGYRSVTVGYPPLFVFQVDREEGFVGHRLFEDLWTAVEAGYEVWIDEEYLLEALEANPLLEASGPILTSRGNSLTRVSLVPK